jgi:Coenzyme PQQ synthesis protein D (PqqD)
MADVAPDSVIARSPAPLTASVDDELVMLDMGTSTYFALDRIGHRIWNLIEQPTRVEAICSALQPDFDVSAETCLADVQRFLAQLEDAGLVEVH